MSNHTPARSADSRYQFSAEDGVSVVFNAQPAKGKRIAVSNASKDTCDECRAARRVVVNAPS